jgi:hypothetical protein
MHCKDADDMTARWYAAIEHYRDTVFEIMNGVRPETGSTAFSILHATAEKARLETENARLALEKHRGEHGCLKWQTATPATLISKTSAPSDYPSRRRPWCITTCARVQRAIAVSRYR